MGGRFRLAEQAVVAAVAFGVAALCGSAGCAQTLTKKTYVLKAARLFDGKSNALVKPGIVVVSDGKIVAAGSSVNVPAGATVIELGDATLLPGFIDAHTHLTMMYREDCRRDSRRCATWDRVISWMWVCGMPSIAELCRDHGCWFPCMRLERPGDIATITVFAKACLGRKVGRRSVW